MSALIKCYWQSCKLLSKTIFSSCHLSAAQCTWRYFPLLTLAWYWEWSTTNRAADSHQKVCCVLWMCVCMFKQLELKKRPVLACYPIDRTAAHLGPPMWFFLCRIALDELEVCAWDFQMYCSSVSSGSFCQSTKPCTHSPCVSQSEGTCTTQGMFLRALTLPATLQKSSWPS